MYILYRIVLSLAINDQGGLLYSEFLEYLHDYIQTILEELKDVKLEDYPKEFVRIWLNFEEIEKKVNIIMKYVV